MKYEKKIKLIFILIQLSKLHEAGMFNPFHATDLFRYPLETSENQNFLMFSGGIERDQWHEMG